MKLLIIGIDGGTWDILGPACDKGWMPNLNGLRTHGAWGALNSTHPPVTFPAWTTLMTGMNPGHHRVCGFFTYNPKTRKIKNVNSTDIRNETLWHKLARHGKKAVVVGVPMTYPPFAIDGILVSGFETPSTDYEFTYPPEFREEILKEIPQLKFMPPFSRKEKRNVKNFPRYLDWLRDNSRDMVKILRMGIDKTPCTTAMVMLKSFDEIMHHFCKLLDFNVDTNSNPLNKYISRFFKELDEVIGSLLKLAEQNDANVLVVSDHGAGVKHATIYINAVLRDLGYLKTFPVWRKIRSTLSKLNPFGSTSPNPEEGIKNIDYSRSAAFVSNVGGYANLYINTDNLTEPNPEKQKEELIAKLRRKLTGVTTPDGRKIIRAAVKPTEVYGDDIILDNLPDLMIIPAEGFSLNARLQKKSIEFAGRDNLSGDHYHNGIIAMKGRNIQAGKKIEANIEDITPTALAMLNLPVTKDMDGKVIKDAFINPLQVVYEEPADVERAESYTYSEKEKSKINSRLADLGYF